MYKIRSLVPFATLKTICEGWFNSVMLYCLPLFGGCHEGELDDLQIVQNQLARLVTFSDSRDHRHIMFNKLKWMTVRQLICYHTLLTVFRVRHSKEPEHLASKLLDDNRNGKIIIPHSNLTLYQKSFIYRGILTWNSLPDKLRCLQDLRKFKIETKEWIFENVERF